MKILLFAINGSYSHTSLSIRCLRNSLEKEGHEVTLLEKNLRDKKEHILEELVFLSKDKELVGFSTYIWNIELMLSLADSLKKIIPNTHINFGGPESSYRTEELSKLIYIDSIISGEGEDAICQLANDILVNNVKKIYIGKPSNNVMKDEGILYKEGDYPKGSMLYYESSRGCPFNCAYCLSSTTEGIRYKDIDQVKKDLLEFEKLPESIKIIKFVDRTFNFNISRANEIWTELLKPNYTKNYHFELCANLLNEESFEILKGFPNGKIQFEFGLQSTNLETLKECSRHINPFETIEKVQKIKEMGNINVHLDLIAGLPYEDYSSFRKSFNDAYFSSDTLQLGFLKLLHGTKLRNKAEEFEIKYTSYSPYMVLSTKWISYDEINKLYSMSEILDRFNEGTKFENCLKYAVKKYPTPFDFFMDFTNFIKERDGRKIQSISQIDAYKVLYNFVSTFIQNNELKEFSSLMHQDFENNENIRTPYFLNNKYNKS